MNRQILILLISVIVLLTGIYFFRGVTIDDAYISARYSKNIATGIGPVFNAGERVEGFSNPLWTFGMAGIGFIIGISHLVEIGRALGVISTLSAFVWILYVMRKNGTNPFPAGIALFLLSFQPELAFWSIAGLETTLYGMLLVVAMFLVGKEEKRKNTFPWSGIIIGFATLTRPEGAAFFIVGLINKLMWQLRDRKFNFRPPTIFAFTFLATVLPYFLFRLFFYEALLPNTFLVKAGGYRENLLNGLIYLITHFSNPVPFLLTSFALFSIPKIKTDPQITAFLLASLAQLSFTIWAGGDWMPLGRFAVPIYFLITPLAGSGLHYLLEKINGRKSSINLYWVTLSFLFVITVTLQIKQYRKLHKNYYWRISHGLDSRIAFGSWLSIMSPKDLKIAYGDMGALPYYSNRRFIDINGLVTKPVAEIIYRHREKQEQDEQIGNYLLNQRPDLIIFVSALPPNQNWLPSYPNSFLSNFLKYYQFAGSLIAYPEGTVSHYPAGRHLVIFLRNDQNLPELSDFLKCSNSVIKKGQNPVIFCPPPTQTNAY